MRTKFFVKVLILTIAVGGLTGCRNGRWFWQKDPKTAGGQPGSITGVPLDSRVGERPEFASDGTRGDFPAVYFDYDSSRIKPSEFTKIEAVAAGLRGNSKRLIIEGHTDERGTAEYNRLLGEKRAQSARQSLVSLGIAGNRLTTVSFGKDRPIDESHGDTAWSRNRRCEFVISSQ